MCLCGSGLGWGQAWVGVRVGGADKLTAGTDPGLAPSLGLKVRQEAVGTVRLPLWARAAAGLRCVLPGPLTRPMAGYRRW